jgi:hypothetical protein
MTYRDDLEAKKLRRRALESELAELRARASALAPIEERARALERELAEAAADVDRARSKVALPLLSRVRIASPCAASWDGMRGDERVRHCASCDKQVFDLSALSSEQAEALLRERTGGLCVRLYRRKDGTVLTSDCPVGAQKARRRRGLAVMVAGSLVATAAWGAHALTTSEVGSAKTPSHGFDPDEVFVMGEVAIEPYEPPPAPSAGEQSEVHEELGDVAWDEG